MAKDVWGEVVIGRLGYVPGPPRGAMPGNTLDVYLMQQGCSTMYGAQSAVIRYVA